MFHVRPVLVIAAVFVLASCGGKKDQPAAGSSAPTPAAKPAPAPVTPTPTPTPAERPPTTESAAGPTTPSVADAPAGTPPPDGKYERVMVDGVTVPMINVTEGGTVVLVDTDGKKPRTWEEQYKRKKAKLAGQFDIHKTDANKNGKFDDDAIDKEGLWLIDTQGNITKH